MCIRDRVITSEIGNWSVFVLLGWHFVFGIIIKRDGRESRIVRCHHDSGNNKAASILRLLRSKVSNRPWWLLTLDLRRRSIEAALLFPESWWHLTMRGSRPSLFMILPNTKRHSNNTKTDQSPISEIPTGPSRPYHNTSPPSWAAYAEIWEIRGNPSSPN